MLKRSCNKIARKFVDKDEHLNADEMRSEESSCPLLLQGWNCSAPLVQVYETCSGLDMVLQSLLHNLRYCTFRYVMYINKLGLKAGCKIKGKERARLLHYVEDKNDAERDK